MLTVLAEHSAATLIHPAAYLGVEYSNEFVMIQITCNDTRAVEQRNCCTARLRIGSAPLLACGAKTS
jgi:Tautomerase enzyme